MQMIKKEWKSIWKNKILLLSFVVICFIPMLYASFFLKGIWDPYGKTGNLPVAVVNNDKAITYGGKTMNVGEELVNQLKTDDNLDWNFVSAEEAQNGLENQKYYMVVTLPEDFSANAATVMDTNPKPMDIKYETNGAFNYLGEVISDSAAKQLKSEVSAKVTDVYATTILGKLSDIKDGFSQAADGAGQLDNGLGTLNDGVNQLGDNVPALSDGVSQLNDGSGTLANGIAAYTNGVDALAAGTNTLSSNSAALQSGVNSLATGVSDGTTQLQSGASQLSDGLNQISSSLGDQITGSKDQLAQLNQGLGDINNGIQSINTLLNNNTTTVDSAKIKTDLTTIGASASQIGTDLGSIKTSLTDGTTNALTALATESAKQGLTPAQTQALFAAVKNELDTENTAVGTAAADIGAQATAIGAADKDLAETVTSLSTLMTSVSQLKQAIAKLATGSSVALPGAQTAINQLSSGLTTVKSALDGQVIPGMSQLESGLSQLQSGLNDGSEQLNTGLTQYTTGVAQANAGAQTLSSNSNALNSGAIALKNGLGTLNGKIPALTSGITALTSGTQQLKDGSSELATKLGDASTQVSAVNTSDQTSTMISEPTTLTKDKYSDVPNYGHALAPYVLSLALYVGCLVFNFIFPIRKIAVKEKSALEWWLSKVTVGVVAAIAMALIEGATLMLIGLSPNNIGQFYFTAIITSLAYMFMIMFLAMAFDNPGRFVAMILLVLQLAASGGTFPVPLTSSFFKAIHSFLPMTHSIYAFRQAISSGLGNSFYASHMIVLVCILIVSVILMLGAMVILKNLHRDNISQLDDNQKLLDDNYSYN